MAPFAYTKKPVVATEPDQDDKKKNAPADNDADDKKKTAGTAEKPKAKMSLAAAPSSAFDSAGFEKDIARYKNVVDSKGAVKKYAFESKITPDKDPVTGKATGKLKTSINYSGPITKHLQPLADKIKGNLDVLEAEKKRLGKTNLEESESDTALKKAGKGDYKSHLVTMEQQNRLRKLSPYQETEIPTKVDVDISNRPGGDAGMGGVIKMSKQTPYDSTQQIYSKPLTAKAPAMTYTKKK